MPHGIAFAVLIEILAIGLCIESIELVQAFVQIDVRVLSASDQLNPVAGGNDHRLFDTWLRRQRLHRLRQPRFRDGELLAHLDRSGLVVHADDDQIHTGGNLCTRLRLVAAQTPSGTAKANGASKAARRPRHPELQRVYSRSKYTIHMMNDSRILGSVKKSGPYLAIASTEPAINPKVMKGKPKRSELQPMSSMACS